METCQQPSTAALKGENIPIGGGITKESTFEDERKLHFKPQDLANAFIHDNAFLSCCLGPDRYSAAASTPFSLVVLGPPCDGKDISGGAHSGSTLSHWFSSTNDSRPFLKSLWQTASFRVCCDCSYDMVLKTGIDSSIKPDLLIGDLDELCEQTKSDIERQRKEKGSTMMAVEDPNKKEIKEWHQVEINKDHSDQFTDLQKALFKLKQQKESSSNPSLHHTVVVYYDGPLGRFDKTLSHINALYQFRTVFPRILLLTDSSSLTEILNEGHHILLPNKELEGVSASCGIFPIGSVCRKIYATGLHWPLHGESLAFGGLTSACNAIVSDRILIETTDPVIFHTNLMSMSTPLQKIRSLVGQPSTTQRVQDTPATSSNINQTMGGQSSAATGGSTAPKSGGSMGDIGGRTQSYSGAGNKNDEPMLHYELGFNQQQPLVPNPSVATAKAGSYGHNP